MKLMTEKSNSESVKIAVKNVWERLCADSLFLSFGTTDKVWIMIEEEYSEPVRAYHTLNHINELIGVLELYKSQITDLSAVILAIIFHDIIYDPTSKVNEEESAKFFCDVLSQHLNEILTTKVVAYIVATKDHKSSDLNDNDLNYFLDFDMSILGTKRERYIEYSSQIRQEYSHVDERTFTSGRVGFVKSVMISE
jgi:predicted metal-dependent HD superfamily phosphohydrolase